MDKTQRGMFKLYTSNITWQKAVDEDGKGFYVRGYASVADVIDRQNEIVTNEALKFALADLIKHGDTLFFNHNYDQPIGAITKAVVDSKGLLIEAFISETRPDIRKQIEEKILKRFSIGGTVLEAYEDTDVKTGTKVVYITKMEIYEVSLVGVPANKHAEVVDYVLKSAYLDFKKKSEMEDDMANAKKKKVEEVTPVTSTTEEAVVITPAVEEVVEQAAEATTEVVEAAPEAITEAAEATEEVAEAVVVTKSVEEAAVETPVVDKDACEVIGAEANLMKSVDERLAKIEKAVLVEYRPILTILDKDVEAVIANFKDLAVGDTLTLKIVAKVVEKAEVANNNDGGTTYKMVSVKAEAVDVVSTETEASQKSAVSEVESIVEELPVEKSIDNVSKVERVSEKSIRKGINVEDIANEEVRQFAGKFQNKSAAEIINDPDLFNSLDEEGKALVKAAWKESLLQK